MGCLLVAGEISSGELGVRCCELGSSLVRRSRGDRAAGGEHGTRGPVCRLNLGAWSEPMRVGIAACSAKAKPPEPSVSPPRGAGRWRMPQVEQSEVLLEERSTQLPLPGHAGLQKGEVIPLAT